MQDQERPSSSLSAHERLFGPSSSSRENSSVSPPESPAGKKGTSISSGDNSLSPIMSPIFKSDTARAIAKEVGLADQRPSRLPKKRSLTISGSNPQAAVMEALNNHQAKVREHITISRPVNLKCQYCHCRNWLAVRAMTLTWSKH